MCMCQAASDSVTLWTVVYQAPLFVGFPRQEYWGALPCPPPGNLPNPGMQPVPLMSPALVGGSLLLAPPGQPMSTNTVHQNHSRKQGEKLKEQYILTPKSRAFSHNY